MRDQRRVDGARQQNMQIERGFRGLVAQPFRHDQQRMLARGIEAKAAAFDGGGYAQRIFRGGEEQPAARSAALEEREIGLRDPEAGKQIDLEQPFGPVAQLFFGKAAIVSDPGIPLASTNYGDYWYLGERLKDFPPGTDHHEMLGLIAPRSFLLLAGEIDGDKTWPFLEAARGLYPEGALGWINHATGHTPPVQAVAEAWTWLAARLAN